MAEHLRRLENALKKIRIDFPGILVENYAAGPVIQSILSSEKTQDEFENVYRMLTAGIEPLIEENTEQLKDSAICYHKVHKEVIAAANSISEAESYLSSLVSALKADNVSQYLEELKEEQSRHEEEMKESETKQALAVDTLSIKDIYSGRLSGIMNNLQYVAEKTARSEIKYQTENALWRIKKEIEKRVKESLRGRGEITQMDVTVLRKISGCSLVAVHEAVDSLMIEIINKISNDLRKSINKKESYTKEEEAHSISRALLQFSNSVSDLLHRVHSILRKEKEEEETLSRKYRYSPELYENIKLNREKPYKSAQISLPLYESAVTEKEIFDKIVEWVQKFFKRLIGNSEHISGDSASYNIEKINRTDGANMLYKELYVNKYGELSASEESTCASVSVMNVYSVKSEESILIIHGCSLEISSALREVLASVLPEHVNLSEKVKDLEISRCFKNKRKSLLALVERATSQVSLDHTSTFLQKYCIKVKEILIALGRLISVPVHGLDAEIVKTIEEVLEKMLPSLNEVFRVVARLPSGEPKDIQYYDKSLTSQEIERWNNPLKESALGPSIFSACTSKKFSAISELMQIPEEIVFLVQRMISTLDNAPQRNNRIKANNEEKTEQKNIPTRLTEIKTEASDLSHRVFGHFTSHLLALAQTTLEQLLIKGDILDRKLCHFLEQDVFLVRESKHVLLEYITTHLLLNIEKCVEYAENPVFRQLVSGLQHQLVQDIPVESDVRVKYSPMNIFYIIPYCVKKDKVFFSGALGMYMESNLISRKIIEISGLEEEIKEKS
ncbi:hypothetical protein NEMIN01_0947 [Nematocida minor]|uniref:uncharacterized protein n=1 Tax=Nematocida minor TaxID=1912983 RepID=UPI00221F56DD|nr:uncharacterized protein NEMIN01_0947 [Nematocida minor]KAI5190248.1 hypothetical protein NEMIN01_0947 [Nematocida minor]